MTTDSKDKKVEKVNEQTGEIETRYSASGVEIRYNPDGTLVVPQGHYETVVEDDGFVRWENERKEVMVGAVAEGLYLERKPITIVDTDTFMYELIGRDGLPVSFHGTTKLDSTFNAIAPGSFVRVELVNAVPTNTPGRKVKLFDTQVLVPA